MLPPNKLLTRVSITNKVGAQINSRKSTNNSCRQFRKIKK